MAQTMAQWATKFNASCDSGYSRSEIAGLAQRLSARFPRQPWGFRGAKMKAKIIVTPKKAVVDPQGKTVQNALAHLGYQGVAAVHVGKYIEIDLTPGTDRAAAQKALNDAAHKFLSNPIIEDYKLEIE
jgi:phosphoribosylformylglycinamidine synthase PurS subunit